MARLCLSESVVFVSYAAIGLIFIFFTDLGVFYVASVWGVTASIFVVTGFLFFYKLISLEVVLRYRKYCDRALSVGLVFAYALQSFDFIDFFYFDLVACVWVCFILLSSFSLFLIKRGLQN